MRLDEMPRSDNIEDRRGAGGGFRVPGGGRGGLGIGTVVVLGLVGYWLGIDPRLLIGRAEILSGAGSSQQESYPGSGGEAKTGAPPDQMGEFVSAVLGGTEAQWKNIFAQYGKTYEAPTLVMFSGATRSGCGFAQSAMGPFYCPNDHKVYLDTSFFQDLERRFRACDVGMKRWVGLGVIADNLINIGRAIQNEDDS
jgi:predicted metalloprotease